MRRPSSSAALRVNVTMQSCCGRSPCPSKYRARATSVVVLPVPAPASTRTRCSGAAAARCCSSSSRSVAISAAAPWNPPPPRSQAGAQDTQRGLSQSRETLSPGGTLPAPAVEIAFPPRGRQRPPPLLPAGAETSRPWVPPSLCIRSRLLREHLLDHHFEHDRITRQVANLGQPLIEIGAGDLVQVLSLERGLDQLH